MRVTVVRVWEGGHRYLDLVPDLLCYEYIEELSHPISDDELHIHVVFMILSSIDRKSGT